MEIITMILSGLALLAASVSLILTIQEKKRNEKQRADGVVAAAKAYEEELRYKTAVSTEIGKLVERLCSLEKGIVPDFEEAKKAVSSVNDFNRGLNAILGYDPFAALEKQRNRVQEGD